MSKLIYFLAMNGMEPVLEPLHENAASDQREWRMERTVLSDISNIATVNLGWYRRSFRSLIWGDEESAVFYIIDNYIFIKLYEKFPAEK